MKKLAAAGAIALALTMTGCTARTAVDVTVTSAQAAQVLVAVEFTGEVAEALHDDPQLLSSLRETFTNRTGQEPNVRSSKDDVRLSAQVDYDHLESSGAITGVSAMQLSGSDRDVQATLTLRDAPDLLTAITSGTSTQADGDVVAQTMAQTTLLEVNITFPGGLEGEPVVTGVDPQAVKTDGSTVTVVRTAQSAQAGSVQVTGDPTPRAAWPFVVGGSLAAALGLALVFARRRDLAARR